MTGGADPYNRGPFPWGREDPALLAHYRALARLYAEHPVLRSGECELFARGDDVLGCRRRDAEEQLTVLVDRTAARWWIET